jgi:hypothetical protein
MINTEPEKPTRIIYIMLHSLDFDMVHFIGNPITAPEYLVQPFNTSSKFITNHDLHDDLHDDPHDDLHGDRDLEK